MAGKAKSSVRVVKRGPRNRALDDMRRFHASLDLRALLDEFCDTVKPPGVKPFYRSSKHFARIKAEGEKQLAFLTWLFGPIEPPDPVMISLYPFAKPLEFDVKRRQGGAWFSDDSLREHSKAIRQEMVALEALRAAGNGITINSLARMEALAKQLDSDFGGVFFIDGLNVEDNMKRAETYVRLHSRILDMIATAQDLYAKSHGINFADMSGFERLLTAQALAMASGTTERESRTSKLMGRIIDMTLEKNVKYETDVPDVIQRVLTDSKKETTKRDTKTM